jgi:probable HAF family extracellular repeat protein
MTSLGTLGGDFSAAHGINDAGQIVGTTIDPNIGQVAFVDSATAGMEDLNTLYASLLVSGNGSQKGFVTLLNAFAINSSGDIAGYGMYWNGTSDQKEGFLLDVPEPSTWALLLGGVGLLLIAGSGSPSVMAAVIPARSKGNDQEW